MVLYNKNLRQEIFDRGEPVDNAVSTTSFNPDFRNQFSARMRDENQDPNKKPFGAFNNEEATNYIQNEIPAIDGYPDFRKPIDNQIAQDFLNKYTATFLVPDEEKATAASTLRYITGDPNSNLQGKFPGSEGVATT